MSFEDRTAEWANHIDTSCRNLGLSIEDTRHHKQQLLLKPTRDRSQFSTVAENVRNSICELREFITTNKRDYIAAGKLSEQAKDQVEEHVGLLVRTITQSLDALKNGVMAAQQPQEDGQPLINEQMAAHLHGAVFVLVELLHTVTTTFDKYRAVRYQRSLERELQQHRKMPQAAAVHGVQQGLPPDKRVSDMGQDMNGHDGSMQQAQQYDSTTQHIIADLRSSTQQAQQIESTMRHITTLNQMISTAVMEQAEMIEQLYNNALDATNNITRGNKELKKTIELNRSSRNWVMVLSIVAGLLLLFFDWFYS